MSKKRILRGSLLLIIIGTLASISVLVQRSTATHANFPASCQLSHGLTPLYRYYNSSYQTHGPGSELLEPIMDSQGPRFQYEGDLARIRCLGDVPDTIPLYACVSIGTHDYFVSTASNCEGQMRIATGRQLGFIYSSQPTGTIPLYRCVRTNDLGTSDHLLTMSPICEGWNIAPEGLLGYVFPLDN